MKMTRMRWSININEKKLQLNSRLPNTNYDKKFLLEELGKYHLGQGN
jgi:hypothetical protein